MALGLVSNIARPGGNLTGVSIDAGLEIWGKRIELLREATGKLIKASFLTTPFQWDAPTGDVIRAAAKNASILMAPALPEGGDIDRSTYAKAFENIKDQRSDGLLVSKWLRTSQTIVP